MDGIGEPWLLICIFIFTLVVVFHVFKSKPKPKSQPKVIIIGFSGIGAAIRLKQEGFNNIIIYEKSKQIGGTWFDNTYPGCACDVPSYLYSYSFEPKLDWTRKWAKQPEILNYLLHCVHKYNLHSHIRLNSAVDSCNFDTSTSKWKIKLKDGAEDEAEFVISAVGQLNVPSYPSIPGMNTFKGASFHSARWNHEIDLNQKRVAIVGNAASAIQIIPEIAPKVKNLVIFQRTPSYIIPKNDYEYSRLTHWMFKYLPFVLKIYRWSIYLAWESTWTVLVNGKSSWNKIWANSTRNAIRNSVADEKLREKITPNYALGCKRILISSDYYPCLEMSNVELVTSKIASIDEGSLNTEDGKSYNVDVIIYATGFKPTEFLNTFEVQGKNGKNIKDVWGKAAKAYLGMTVPGFPNFFIMYGPNTNLGHNSIIFIIECQVNHIVALLQNAVKKQSATVEVKEEVFDEYQKLVRQRMGSTVWVESCNSWYRTEDGTVVTVAPFSTIEYWWRTRNPNMSNFLWTSTLNQTKKNL